ncbi:hypothetical protein FO488_05615 [Geobacter sp. FeAm09]|nr:hypothetical protein FO488_05615 [Geobacter sp. FeAm09]
MDNGDYRQFDHQFEIMRNDPIAHNTGRPADDSRYRNIIRQLDEMFEQLLYQPDKDLAADFDQLLETMMEHVGNENGCMRMVRFPQAVQHCLHHQFICSKTAELRHRFGKHREALPEELGYLRLLWLVHIQLYDQPFETFLAS